MSTYLPQSDSKVGRQPSRTKASRLAAIGPVAGLLAGPVMALTWIAQALIRDGYDLTRHPMSLLALGSGGWVQILNFVVSGLLVIVCAAGLRPSMAGGVGQTWAPRLVAFIGIGLICSGVFTVDPGAGFPTGAPEGAPDYSWHGILHEVALLIVVGAWVAFFLVLRRRFARAGSRGLARLCVSLIVASFVLVGLPHLDSFPVRMVLVGVGQLLSVGAAALYFRRQHTREESLR